MTTTCVAVLSTLDAHSHPRPDLHYELVVGRSPIYIGCSLVQSRLKPPNLKKSQSYLHWMLTRTLKINICSQTPDKQPFNFLTFVTEMSEFRKLLAQICLFIYVFRSDSRFRILF